MTSSQAATAAAEYKAMHKDALEKAALEKKREAGKKGGKTAGRGRPNTDGQRTDHPKRDNSARTNAQVAEMSDCSLLGENERYGNKVNANCICISLHQRRMCSIRGHRSSGSQRRHFSDAPHDSCCEMRYSIRLYG